MKSWRSLTNQKESLPTSYAAVHSTDMSSIRSKPLTVGLPSGGYESMNGGLVFVPNSPHTAIDWQVADIFDWQPPSDCKLILCDPPYGTGQRFKSFFAGVPDLDDSDMAKPFKILERVLSWNLPVCYFCDSLLPFRFRLPMPERVLFWKTSWVSGFKSSSSLPRQVDLILCYGTVGRGILKINGKTVGALIDDDSLVSPVHKSYVKHKGGLPVEKGWGIGAVLAGAFSDIGELVVDVCCGTGSLAAGATSIGRRVIAVDIEPAYILRGKELYGI